KGIFAEEVAQANADVTPARVKPGDPEIRVQAPARARVHVTLPWAKRPVRAVWDAPSGEHVARFLVPAGWPDGSWTATVTIDHAAGGRPMIREVRTVELHVDTRAAAVAVVSAPSTVHPGDALELAFKPAIPVDEIVAALRTDSPGGAGDALKSAMDVKEILVRAPWGEVARAKMDGPLGLYRATLHVPRLQARGDAELEVVACDTAGNVSRRPLVVSVASSSAASWAGGMILLIAAFGQLFARRRRSSARSSPAASAPSCRAPTASSSSAPSTAGCIASIPRTIAPRARSPRSTGASASSTRSSSGRGASSPAPIAARSCSRPTAGVPACSPPARRSPHSRSSVTSS